MSDRKRGVGAFLVVAAGVVTGAALEEYVYRRAFKRRADPEASEPIGRLPGESLWVKAFDGTQIHVRAYGPSDAHRTLVLAHGAIETHVIWHYQARDLLAEGGYRLLAYDARGHGSSGPAKGPDGNTPLTAYTMARDLVAVVRQTTKQRVVLVGHSMGGMVIQALWQHGENQHIADQVAGVVFTNTAYTADLHGWRREGTLGQRMFERVEDVLQRIPRPPKIVDKLRVGTTDLAMLVGRVAYGDDPSPRHIATSVKMYEQAATPTLNAFIDFARFDARDALQLIDAPALIIAGSKDAITPPHLSKDMAELIPDAELVTFEGCGHTSPFERHEQVSAYITKFAERVLP